MLLFSLSIGTAFHFCNNYASEPLHIPLSIARSFLGSFVASFFFLYDQVRFPDSVSGAMRRILLLLAGLGIGAGISVWDWQYSAYQAVFVFFFALLLVSLRAMLSRQLKFQDRKEFPDSYRHPAFLFVSALIVLAFVYPLYSEIRELNFRSWEVIWILVLGLYTVDYFLYLLAEIRNIEENQSEHDSAWQKPAYAFMLITIAISMSSFFVKM